MNNQKIFFLDQKDIPRFYYNIYADLPVPVDPPLHPSTKEPVGPADLSAIFPMELIKQEVTQERFVEIPDEVRDYYRLSRPTPLIRALHLEKALNTPAKIFYKYEGANPSGSHKTNTSIAQAYYNREAGIKRLVTETGAGQWGSSLALACKRFGLECEVFMVKVSFEQKPYRKTFMRLFDATVHPSPTSLTAAGRAVLASSPDSPGSLGIAISEAIEMALQRDDTNYSLGSVLNFVLLHQTVIGEETRLQMELADAYPDIVIGCVGGGSSFAGLAFPFLRDKLTQGTNIDVIGVEPASCPTLTQGSYSYDFGDEAGLTPLMKMYTLGHKFIPDKIHAGGLRYHGAAPSVSLLKHHGLINASAYTQQEVFAAAQFFAHHEGIIPAPESAHGICEVLKQAEKCRIGNEQKTILFNLSGHGFLDLGSYAAYLDGELDVTAKEALRA